VDRKGPHENYERKEVKTMKYETPQLTALSAINAIQLISYPNFKALSNPTKDNSQTNDVQHAYADWEE